MSCLIRVSSFPGGLGHASWPILTMRLMAGMRGSRCGLGHIVSAQPLEGLETKVNHMRDQPHLCDQLPVKPGTPGSGELPGLAISCAYCHTSLTSEVNPLHWERTAGLSWTLPQAPLPFTDFSLDPSAVIHHSHEYSGFYEFCGSFW